MKREIQDKVSRRREIIRSIESFEAKKRARRSWVEKVEDRIVSVFGTTEFLIFNFIFFLGWVVINSGLVPFIRPFDPYPFILLITIVSLEAIVLAIFVLITQNRQSRIESLREETELQVDLISEQEVTKVLKILAVVLRKLGVDPKKDPELQKMLKPLDPEEIERQLENQLNK